MKKLPFNELRRFAMDQQRVTRPRIEDMELEHRPDIPVLLVYALSFVGIYQILVWVGSWIVKVVE